MISLYLLIFWLLINFAASQSDLCRTTCGDIPIRYPFGIDDGCGSPYYRRLLLCTDNSTTLLLRTPSGRYPVRSISYSDPHLVLSDPSMWSCSDGVRFRPATPLALDTSVRLSLSPQNDYIFFDCDRHILAQPKTALCDRFPDQCSSICDTSSYLCRNLPGCPAALSERTSCCSYYPRASESLRLMLGHCASYTSVYWKTVGPSRPYDQVPEYGVRVDFQFPVTTSCFQCQDYARGGGTCGFDALSQRFLCLCSHGNVTTYCTDSKFSGHGRRIGEVAGTTLCVAVAVGVGVGVWYWKRLRRKSVVTCGLQTNENRLF